MIEIVDLHKSFNNNHVLRGLNLTINHGETMVVIGGSGCGKSVLLKHIIGILKPDKGRVLISEKDISKMDETEMNKLRKRFGMLFQGAALFDSMPVWENVGFSLKEHRGLPDNEIRRIAAEKLSLVGLKEIENLMPSELSGGMRKRVGLARAIAMDPDILLYDEPTTGLDPIMADVINELIIKMKERLNVTSIVITHDMVSAYKIADRIAMMYDGIIQGMGAPEEIKETSDPIIRQFIAGSSEGPIRAT